ncbi:hypothetical protein [Candidatus Albibeggiatoa sp. nov. BB20]|uniref:hypothetical protein n=1 Tax=Candidatus Albibeggiatoa sp. nov. BB20 TaxID=3162723 RepID=UPI003365628E
MFSVENIESDSLECPLCGVIHNNSLVSRASILVDKQQAENQLNLINEEIDIFRNELADLRLKLEEVKIRIIQINKKYNTQGQEKFSKIINKLASQSIQKDIRQARNQKKASYDEITNKQKSLKKEQKKLASKEDIQELDSYFTYLIQEFFAKLDALNINFAKVYHPTDYKKFTDGGAIENERAILAYQLAIFNLVYHAQNEIPAPLVIDTPNQQEQSAKNYERIINTIMNATPEQAQVILCGMETLNLNKFKEKAHVIYLDDEKLLKKSKYKELSEELSHILEVAKSDEQEK